MTNLFRALSVSALAIVFASAISLCFLCSVAAKQEPWRKTVRDGQIDLRDKDYARAIAVYKQAIAQIEESSPKNEARFDVYLNLSNAYIRNNQLAEAENLLQELAPSILNGSLDDPLIKVRYWRRRGDLYCAQGQTGKCAEAYIAATKILRSYLPYSGYRELIQPLCAVLRLQDWDAAATFIAYMHPPAQLDGRSKQLLLEAIEGTAMHLRRAMWEKLIAADYKTSSHLLLLLSQFDPQEVEQLKCWLNFYVHCPQPQKYLNDAANERLDRLLKRQSTVAGSKKYVQELETRVARARKGI